MSPISNLQKKKNKTLKYKDSTRLKIKGWNQCIFHNNLDQMKAGVVVLILDKLYFRAKNTTWDKDSNFMML